MIGCNTRAAAAVPSFCAFKLLFCGLFRDWVGEGLAPPATQKSFCYLMFLRISGGASPSPTARFNSPTNPNLKIG